MISMRKRIELAEITMEFVMAGSPPEDMPEGSVSYQVTLHNPSTGESLTTPYHMGPALCRDPEIVEVLDSLCSNAAGYENARSFEEWAEEYGYDTDSRSAERVYRAVADATSDLRRFLGGAYDAFLYKTERV